MAIHFSREQWIIGSVFGLFLVALAILGWDAFVFYRTTDAVPAADNASAREGTALGHDIGDVIKQLDERAAKSAAIAPIEVPSPVVAPLPAATATPSGVIK